ncbi:hypothetical protein [Streptomyces sp. NBC_00996]|uniref:hypothetical protein n=1 Tax=Streptomyces sp. NBC_00996 TaxID=2903710 RepID=UPI00386C0472|nr:hypothetical protein OG390_17405 [Streptomyces sp. NBC_00996]
MPILIAVASGIVLAATVGLAFGLSDTWFCRLLSLACLVGAADMAYRELTLWAVALLIGGVALAGASLWATYRDRRTGRGGT